VKILFIDSATEACSAGLWCDGAFITRCELAPRAHTHLLLPMVQAVLAEAAVAMTELDLIAFGQGPGSFTGVRIATACAQGMALGLDIPVLGVSSLATLAQAQVQPLIQVQGPSQDGANKVIHAAIDARMGEVYHAAFRVGADLIVQLIGAERVLNPAALLAEWPQSAVLSADPPAAPPVATGSGFGRYPALVHALPWQAIFGDALPEPRFALALAAATPRSDWQDPTQAAPVYLRDNVAQVKAT
jgi:tRNA threonylcarbamoyladenosine biosynthesis protein TsaB